MYNDAELDRLLKLSKNGMEQMKIEMKKQEKVMELVLKNVPDSEKGKVEKLKALTNKVINLHKEGKTEEAQKVTEEIKNLI